MLTNPNDKWYHVKPSEVEELYKILKTIVENISEDNQLTTDGSLEPYEMLTRAREIIAKIEIFYL